VPTLYSIPSLHAVMDWAIARELGPVRTVNPRAAHTLSASKGESMKPRVSVHDAIVRATATEAAVRDEQAMSRRAFTKSALMTASSAMAMGAATIPLGAEGIETENAMTETNKAIVGRWFTEFWGNPWNPKVIDELAASDMLLQYSLHAPRRSREDVRAFMMGFREAFPDLSFAGAADLIAEGEYVVGRWVGGGTHTGPAFTDFLAGTLPAASGRKMHFTGTTVVRVQDGKITEEIGLDDSVTALTQLGLIRQT
jgi:predicted ester cyclase